MWFFEHLISSVMLLAEQMSSGVMNSVYSILLGVIFGYASVRIAFQLNEKRSEAIVKETTSAVEGFIIEKKPVSVFNTARFDYFYLPASILSWMLCFFLLDIGGVIAFSVSNILCSMLVPILEMRKLTFELIEDTIYRTRDGELANKKLVKEFYRVLLRELKPGRDWSDFFVVANDALENNLDYIEVIDSKLSQ